MTPTVAAYVYPGWHSCPERDRHFPAGWSEWDLVYDAGPRFPDHRQPNLPLLGRYDDSDPTVAARQIDLARRYGVDLFVYGFFWSRGKRVFEGALDRGFLAADAGRSFPFALMWANRMPRRILPVKTPRSPLIDPTRLVHTDPDDFLAFIRFVAEVYFSQPNYFRVRGEPYLSIFDTNFFLRQLGASLARDAIAAARAWSHDHGYGGLHLAAIDPVEELRPQLEGIGFSSVTHYVLLPEWKGAAQQEFATCAALRQRDWPRFRAQCALPYHPSVSPGWDATPRAADYGKPKPARYPWSPVVIGNTPAAFESLVRAAGEEVVAHEPDPLLFIASWNEWSEGHYLEPDERFGYGWLEAVRDGVGR